MDILLPVIADRHVTNSVQDLKDLLKQSDEVSLYHADYTFNSCKYFFVSYRVAKAYGHLNISRVILNYQSQMPRRLYGKEKSAFRAIFLFLIFYLLLNLPQQYQDFVLKILLTAVLGSLAGAVSSYGVFVVGGMCILILGAVHISIQMYDEFASRCVRPHEKEVAPIVDEFSCVNGRSVTYSDLGIVKFLLFFVFIL